MNFEACWSVLKHDRSSFDALCNILKYFVARWSSFEAVCMHVGAVLKHFDAVLEYFEAILVHLQAAWMF